MTLPDRADKAPASPSPPAWPARPRWGVGDRVLAPWEPQFLCVGRVAELKGTEALIEFEDGDAGWVLLDQIRPVAVERGQKVLSRRQMGPHFSPGEIREVRGDEVCVVFADGQGEEWTRIAALRIPCQVMGPGAEPSRAGAPRETYTPGPGDRVWAPWDSGMLFVGTVDQIQDNDVHIHFDNGNRGWVLREQLVPLQIPVGLRVLGRWKMGSLFYAGVVAKVQGERLFIKYDDGDREWTTPAALALPCQPFGPNARPTKEVRQGGRGVGGWVVFVIFAILLALLRAGCRAG
jgi:hypothetical protein